MRTFSLAGARILCAGEEEPIKNQPKLVLYRLLLLRLLAGEQLFLHP